MIVERIPVSAGGPEGVNSAYVLPERGILIDPGPPGDTAWRELCEGLQRVGVEPDTIDHVVATHWHADHVGLTTRLAAAADATIHMHERDAPLLADYEAARQRRLRRDEAALREWGVPPSRAAAVIERDTPSPLPSSTAVTSHTDGDTIAGTTVVHTPGHTEGHLALSVDDHLFVGDTILPMYTPNVGGSDTRSTNPIPDYLASLDRIASHDGVVYPGHGEDIDVSARLETIRRHQQTRSERVFDRVVDMSEPTPWDIAVDLFGEMRGVHVKFGAGEVAAHLSNLIAADEVAVVTTAPLRVEPRDDIVESSR